MDPNISEKEGVQPRVYYTTVITRNAAGELITRGGAAVVANIIPTNGRGKKRMEIEKASLTYLLDEIDSVVEDLEDGTYEIVFKQPPAGQYQLTFFSHSFSFLLSFYCTH